MRERNVKKGTKNKKGLGPNFSKDTSIDQEARKRKKLFEAGELVANSSRPTNQLPQLNQTFAVFWGPRGS